MSTFTDIRELGSRLRSYNMEMFKEPRGVIRILQLIFAIVNIVVLTFYKGYVEIEHSYCDKPATIRLPFSYPFDLSGVSAVVNCSNTSGVIHPSVTVALLNDFTSEAEFLFYLCWLSVLYVIVISVVYVKYQEEYESVGKLALADFGVTVLLSVIWIACLGAWGYGQGQLKNSTSEEFLSLNLHYCVLLKCTTISRSSVVGITQTLILSFLNFFLWAASLWFVYKETPWYVQAQRT